MTFYRSQCLKFNYMHCMHTMVEICTQFSPQLNEEEYTSLLMIVFIIYALLAPGINGLFPFTYIYYYKYYWMIELLGHSHSIAQNVMLNKFCILFLLNLRMCLILLYSVYWMIELLGTFTLTPNAMMIRFRILFLLN